MRSSRYAWLFAIALGALVGPGVAQEEHPHEFTPGHELKERPAPGTHTPFNNRRQGPVIGGRPGTMRPRVPTDVHPGGSGTQAGPVLPLLTPQAPPAVPRPVYVPNPWVLLFEMEDEGPSDGLTLGQAIDRLVQASITLRARSLDIPQARADVLTAGLHANPIVYADGQLLPYKHYNVVTNPGGPSQYDLNFAYPLDVSGKRQARVAVASAAQRVVEALYQDAVRQEIDRLGDAYVDALAARLAVRTTRGGLARLEELQKRTAAEKKDPHEAELALRQLKTQRQTMTLALLEAENAWRTSLRSLATMLDLPRESIATLELRGTIDDQTAAPPPQAEVVNLALANRPDYMAYRLGVERSRADVHLSKANRMPDVYSLYQPYTYQNNAPYNSPSSKSWAAGVTVTVPIFDRNQGNIRRAEINVEQSQLELRALERRVITEVESAYEDYLTTQRGIRQIEQEMLPEIRRENAESLKGFRDGTLDATAYLTVRRDLDDLGRQYRDLLVRHRRAMLDVNTAVGVRVFP